MQKYHIVGNHMSRLRYIFQFMAALSELNDNGLSKTEWNLTVDEPGNKLGGD